MLQLSNTLVDKAILSLRTGGPIATIIGTVINPDNLKIEGFYCQDRFDKRQLILLSQDVRESLPQGLVVNDHDVLVDAEDLVRLKKVLELKYQLIGKQVETVSKQKIGKVSDFAVETETMYIQKIYVAQSIFKSFAGGSLSIDRNQVIETTPRKIVINDLEAMSRAAAPAVV